MAVPLLLTGHRKHGRMMAWWDGREAALSGHAAVETYSVLTRLPGDARVASADAVRLMDDRFAPPLLLSTKGTRGLANRLARLGITGGAVYDALVGLAAAEHDVELATRDGRARTTYEAVGARVVIVT